MILEVFYNLHDSILCSQSLLSIQGWLGEAEQLKTKAQLLPPSQHVMDHA